MNGLTFMIVSIQACLVDQWEEVKEAIKQAN